MMKKVTEECNRKKMAISNVNNLLFRISEKITKKFIKLSDIKYINWKIYYKLENDNKLKLNSSSIYF